MLELLLLLELELDELELVLELLDEVELLDELGPLLAGLQALDEL